MLNRNRFGRLAVHGGVPVRCSPLRMGRNFELIGGQECEVVNRVLKARSLFRYYGPELQGRCEELERSVCTFLQVRHSLAVSSGTAALRCALKAIAIGDGDEVLVPSYTFVATINAVILSGAVPVFLPINHSLNIDPGKIEPFITSRTKAILVAHLENLAVDLQLIKDIANKYNLFLIEDACQAFGVKYKGQMVGTIGDVGCYSAQQEKNISAGEGGIVVTNNANLFDRLLRYHDQGGTVFTQSGVRGRRLESQSIIGENYRMSEVTAAIASVQLGRVKTILEGQQVNHGRIEQGLADSCPDLLTRHKKFECEDGGSAFVFFAKSGAWAERTVNALQWEGVQARRFYGGLPAFAYKTIADWMRGNFSRRRLREMKGQLQLSRSVGEAAVIVPVGAGFSDSDCRDVIAAVAKVSDAYKGVV